MNTTFAPLNVEVTWPPTAGQEDYPVVNVDWCDAASFCQWSGKRLCGRLGPGTLDSKQAANFRFVEVIHDRIGFFNAKRNKERRFEIAPS